MDAGPDSVPPLPPAAAVYGSGTLGRDAVARFARDLMNRGWRVGGLLQESLARPDGRKLGVDAVEIDTGRRIPIVRYSDAHLARGLCGLDTGLLADATAALRRAIAARVDLLAVEKFGEQEREGGGFADEILAAAAEGIPTLVAVSVDALDRWNAITGGLGVLLPMDEAALWRWWGPHRLYRELAFGVSEAPARRVVAGVNFVFVEGPDGCGLAQTPPRVGDCGPPPGEGALAGRPLAGLAALLESWDPFAAAIGLAAVNAHHNRPDLAASTANGLDMVAGADGPVASVGRFPGLSARRPDWAVIEREPETGEYPATAASWLMPGRTWTAVTASTLVDRALPGLLAGRGMGRVALVGPSAPLTPRLHAYGIDLIAGFVVEDPDGCARAVAEGAGMRGLKPFGRFATLIAPGA